MASSFSYAQAAKGEAMSRHASQEGSASQPSETSQVAKNDVQEQEKAVGLGLDILKNAQTQETSSVPASSFEGNHEDQPKANVNSTSSKAELVGASSSSESSNTVSKPISDDVGSVTPADSDSNWDKVSQDSRHEQADEKVDGDAEAAKLSSEKSQAQMKEAPVPVVNIWKKRMEDAKSKIIPNPAPAPRKTERSATLSNGERSSSKSTIAADHPSLGEASARQRVTRAGSNNSPVTAPPPSSDASSWPTPNLAKAEDKKKESEPETEKPATKAHGKEKWEKIAFVPTAVFNTPLPIRGGARGGRIGSRGGRESISRGGSVSATLGANGDRSNTSDETSEQASTSQIADRSKFKDSNANRGGPVYKPKRSSSAGPSSSQEAGQNGDVPFDKRGSFGHRTFVNQRSVNDRRTSTSTQTDAGSVNGHERRQNWPVDANGDRPVRSERHYHSRLNTVGTENTFWGTSRDRGEGRSERGGRGNWRGGKSNAQSFGNGGSGSPYQQNHGFTNGKPYSEQRHNSHPAAFGNGRESRHSRTNSRSQSIPNAQALGRFATQGTSNNGLPNLQTDMANFYPFATQPTTVMSAVPFSYVEQVQLPAMLQMQIEYYLSLENLCKDLFLRKNMDSQGFVLLHVLHKFNRIKSLTTDANLIKWVCARSPLIELCTGPDGLDRIRKAEDWQQWIMPMGEREPLAQSDGPAQIFPARFDNFANGFDMASPIFPQSHPMSPNNPALMNGFHGEPTGLESFDPRGQFMESTVQTPLTANVPDFKPVMANHTSNGQPSHGTEPEEKVSDSDLQSVRVLVNTVSNEHGSSHNATNEDTSTAAGNHIGDNDSNKENVHPLNGNASVFVNGSGQPSHGTQEVHNGAASSQPKARIITWIGPGVDSAKGEAYGSLRARALEQRRDAAMNHCPEALADLFDFWARFLVNNFNTKAYQEFHSTALEEANAKQSLVGLKHLSSFYSACLSSDTVISDRLVDDFIGLANVEFNNLHIQQQRPALQSLSSFWKTGTSSITNHTTLGRKLSQPLVSALESGDFLLP